MRETMSTILVSSEPWSMLMLGTPPLLLLKLLTFSQIRSIQLSPTPQW